MKETNAGAPACTATDALQPMVSPAQRDVATRVHLDAVLARCRDLEAQLEVCGHCSHPTLRAADRLCSAAAVDGA
jgi:hypothetical protein